MEGLLQAGEPQTPYLHPQDLAEEVGEVPDFFLDDDAGVGSPMDFSEDYSESTVSLSTILALGEALSPCPSPTPSLVSDISLISEASIMSDSEGSDDTFKMKKMVHWSDSVEVVPYSTEEPKSTAPLKPPQELPQYKQRMILGNSDYSKPEDIGVLYGLGRAGSPRSSSLIRVQQREYTAKRPAMQPTDDSDSEEEQDGPYQRRASQYHQQQKQLTVPLYPQPSWRTAPQKPHHDLPPRVKSPGEMDMVGGGYGGYEDARYILGQTSPISPSSPISFSPPPIPFSPSLSPPPIPGDGVYRRESQFRNSLEYHHGYPFHHPQPQRHTEAVKAYMYWKDGEFRYEDQLGRRIYPGGGGSGSSTGNGGGNSDFKLDLWPVKEDSMGEGSMGRGGNLSAVVPGGKMTLREQRQRTRGMRR